MHRLLWLFVELKHAFTTPLFYLGKLRTPLKSAILFFVLVCGLSVLLNSIDLRFQTLPPLIELASKELPKVTDQLPDTTVFRYQEGKLIIEGVTLPVLLQTPENFRAKGFPPTLVAILDSNASGVLNLGEQTMHIRYPIEGTMIDSSPVSYSDLFPESFTLTKTQIREAIELRQTVLPRIASWLLLFAFPILWIASMISTLLAICLYTLLVHLLSPVIGIRFTLHSLFKLGLYIGGVALLIDAILQLLYSDLNVSFFSLAFFGILALVCFEIKKNRVQYKIS